MRRGDKEEKGEREDLDDRERKRKGSNKGGERREGRQEERVNEKGRREGRWNNKGSKRMREVTIKMKEEEEERGRKGN